MKRTLSIILGVVAVFLILGITLARLAGPRIGNTFSTISNQLPGGPAFGYGGGAPDVGVAPALPAPAGKPRTLDNSTGANVSKQAVASGSEVASQERKVIKNDQLSLVVKDPEKAMKDIIALTEKMNGYVVSSNLYQSTYGPNNTPVPQAQVVVRVPADKLTDVLDQIKKDAVKVQSENLTGQDVTDQYVDLQSRLAADQAAADQLEKIMQDARRTEDVLSVFQQLQQIQSDIEVLKGQIKYIDESTATSEISATLIAEESAQPLEVGGWKIQGTARDAIQDLIFFTQGLTRFLIRFVLLILPSLLLIAIPLYLVFLAGRGVYRRFRKPGANAEVVKSDEAKK